MIKSSLTILKNNKAILEGFSLIFALRMLQMFLGFAATYFLVRAISIEQYGQYNFVIGAIGVLSIFSLTEMGNAVMQSVARGFYGTYRIALKKTVLFSLIGSFILVAMAGFYFFVKNESELACALLLSAFAFPFLKAMTQWKSLRMAEHKFREMTRIEGLNSITTNIAIILAALLVPQNYLWPLVMFLFIPSIRNLIAVTGDLRRIPSDSADEKGSIDFGLKTSFFSGINMIAMNLDRIVLFFFMPAAAVAFYSAADRLSDVFKSITQDLSGAMASKLAKQSTYTKKLDNLFMLYGLGMGAALVFFSFTFLPPVFLLIFGDKYAEAVPYAQAMMCSVAIGNFSIMRFRYIRSQIDAKSYRDVTLLSSISRISSLLILVPLFGVWGAVASAYIARITTAGMVHFIVKKRYLTKSFTTPPNEAT